MSKKNTYTVNNQPARAAVLCALFLLLCTVSIVAQGWEKIYGTNAIDEGRAIIQTPDEGFVLTGTLDFNDIFILKTDPDGNQIWLNSYGDPSLTEFGKDIVLTEDGGYVAVGTSIIFSSRKVWAFKTDSKGEMLWQTLPNNGNNIDNEGLAITNTDDGGYAISGIIDTTGTDKDIYLSRIDSEGNIMWEKSYDTSGSEFGNDVIQTSDGGFIIVGNVEPEDSIFFDVIVLKTDENGTLEWHETYGGNAGDEGAAIIETPDNEFVFTGYTQTDTTSLDVYLVKIDSMGTELFSRNIGGVEGSWGLSVAAADGGYLIAGAIETSVSDIDAILIKTDNEGNKLWQKLHGRNFSNGISEDFAYAVKPTIDGGMVLAGDIKQAGIFNNDIYLVKTDSLGNIFSNYIEGNVYRDFNNNCLAESGDHGIEDWVIIAEGSDRYYGTSDAAGNYSILVDTGSYNVSLVNPAYWAACIDNYNITFDSFYDTLQIDFAIHPDIPCAFMEVDLATAFTRPCEESIYYVNYCNHGTQPTFGAYVEITLDEKQELISAEVPYITQQNAVHLFAIGDVPALHCARFAFVAALSCDADLIETTCVEAHIYPDESCIETDPGWDGSSLSTYGECDGDSIRFEIQNVGEGDLLAPEKNYIVIEDQVIFRQGPVGPLNSGGTKALDAIPANGSTYRLIVEQSDGHPGYSYPTIAIEGCNDGANENIYGQFAQFPEDDANPFVSVDCHENINSIAISQIEGYPKGYIQDTFYIAQSTDITYQLNFQNTDLLAATRVVVTDTIPEQLDITSIQPGASSHPYDFEVYNNGIVKFTFDGIELPGSSMDEIGSIGFVKFRISQQPNVQAGTMVLNRAATYMQFESPVKSDFTKHTTTGSLLDVLVVNVVEYPTAGLDGIKVYPNPFSTDCNFEILGDHFRKLEFSVFDITGRLVHRQFPETRKFSFSRTGLTTGTYVFRLTTDGKLLSTGKLSVH